MAQNVDETVAVVKCEYEEYPTKNHSDVFRSFQSVFEGSTEVQGINDFKIQHRKKHG